MRVTFLLAVLCASVFSSRCFGDTILFDSNGFENYAIGALGGQNGWVIDSGGPGAGGANYQIQNGIGVGGTRGATVGGGVVTDWAFPVLNYTPSAIETIIIQADLSRTLGTTVSSFGYTIDVYTPTATRITRFGLVNNAAGSISPFFTATTGTTLVSSPVAANAFVSFRAELNFTTDTMNLFVNGVNVASNVALLQNASVLGDADFQVSTAAGADDAGFLDNYRVSVAVPEPGSIALGFLALSGLLIRKRLRRK